MFSIFINSVHRVLHHCHILCFADDIKLYLQVRSSDDCTRIQADLNRFSDWCGALGLSLNLSKCKIMSFTRTRSPFFFSYCLNSTVIPRVLDCVMDLGFKLSYNLDPGPHIQYVCCKALKILGFVMRLARDFRLGISIKTLFCTLVRPILEYGVVVWNPHTADGSKQLERVQRRFLRFAKFILRIPCEPHNYTPVENYLGLSSLAERRHNAGIKFLTGLLNNKIDSAVLMSLLCFRVPPRPSRSNATFYVPHSNTNYLANEPLRKLMSSANVDPDFNFLM